jgi:hypothetical protein
MLLMGILISFSVMNSVLFSQKADPSLLVGGYFSSFFSPTFIVLQQ